MNYGEIKHNLTSLVFGETSDLEEVEDLGYLYDSVNRALSEIEVFFPYVAKYEFDIDEADANDGENIYIDMSDLPGYLGLADTPVLYEKDGETLYKRFSAFEIEDEHTIVIDPVGHVGSYRIMYKCHCSTITSTTPDTFVPEIPLKAHHLIPILAAYWLWLDDDEQKATQYRNLYEQDRDEIRVKDKATRIKITPDKWGVI